MHAPVIHTFSSDTVLVEAARTAANILTQAVTEHHKVLILLSGGSSLKLYRYMFALLPSSLSFENVMFGVVDERVGAGAESNEYQLRTLGLITTIEQRGGHFVSTYSAADYILAFVGIGDDGHTVGWLPTQTAEKFDDLFNQAIDTVEYTVDPSDSQNQFTHRRTITLTFMKNVDQVVAFATGEKKQAAVQRFVKQIPPLYQTPALGLYYSKRPPILLTDVTPT